MLCTASLLSGSGENQPAKQAQEFDKAASQCQGVMDQGSGTARPWHAILTGLRLPMWGRLLPSGVWKKGPNLSFETFTSKNIVESRFSKSYGPCDRPAAMTQMYTYCYCFYTCRHTKYTNFAMECMVFTPLDTVMFLRLLCSSSQGCATTFQIHAFLAPDLLVARKLL